MKISVLKTIVLITAFSFFSSCNKDDDQTTNFPKENFLEGYLTSSGFFQSSLATINDQTYEMGLEFSSLLNGKITDLKVKIPASNNELKITIWDTESATALQTEIVNYTLPNTEQIFDIVDLNIVKNKKYAITFNTNDFYYHQKFDESSTSYPIIVKNIKIEKYLLSFGSSQQYPETFITTVYTGDLSFNFQPNE